MTSTLSTADSIPVKLAGSPARAVPPYQIAFENLTRIALRDLEIHAQCPEDLASTEARLTPSAPSSGTDGLGAYTRTNIELAMGAAGANLEVREYGDSGLVVARLKAEYADSNQWWNGKRFGLRGSETAIVRLRLPEIRRGLACAMRDEWWTQPAYVRSETEVPALTQFLLWQDKDGTYGVLVPLVGQDGTTHVRGTPDALNLCVSSGEDGRLAVQAPVFVAAFGTDPYALIEKAYRAALSVLENTAKHRTEKPYPEVFEYLGWCTWDAFYREVTADGIEQKLHQFRAGGVPLGFVLIDDGWYPMRDSRMTDTRTDRDKFPDGLGAVVRKLKNEFGVRHVGVWHALTGYWSGIAPDHTLGAEYEPYLLYTKGGYVTPAMGTASAFGFWTTWHEKLASEGIEFVKVDGQGAIHRYSVNIGTIPEAARNVQRALQASVGVHFGGTMINCMSMSQELAWFWSMSNVTRSSTDYMIHGEESSPGEHARSNAYNSLWMSQLSWCDWDMFRSDHPNVDFHIALRVLSGGPIYVSDGLGGTAAEKLRPLVSDSGRLLRCDEVGLPVESCLLVDPIAEPIALTIMNRAGEGGVLGVFNVHDGGQVVHAEISPSAIPTLKGEAFAVWGFRRGSGRLLRRGERFSLPLEKLQSEIFTLAPLIDDVGVIGVVEKALPSKTVEVLLRSNRELLVQVKDKGRFVAYTERTPAAVLVNGESKEFRLQDGFLSLPIEQPGSLLHMRFNA